MKPLLSIALIIASLLPFCEDKNKMEETEKIKYLKVDFKTGPETLTFDAAAQKPRPVYLYFQVSGGIEDLRISEGSRLRKGSIVATLNQSPFREDLDLAKFSRDAASEQAARTKKALEKGILDFERRRIGADSLDLLKLAVRETEEDFRRSEVEYEKARKRLGQTTLRALADGKVISVEKSVGEAVDAREPIAIYEPGAEIEAKVLISREAFEFLSIGDSAKIVFQKLPDREFFGSIYRIPEKISESLDEIPVAVGISGAGEEVTPGMRGKAMIVIDFPYEGSGIKVPAKSVGEDDLGKYVFIAEFDSAGEFATLRKRRVSVGDSTAAGVDIIAGLRDGDLIALGNALKLKEKQKARIRR